MVVYFVCDVFIGIMMFLCPHLHVCRLMYCVCTGVYVSMHVSLQIFICACLCMYWEGEYICRYLCISLSAGLCVCWGKGWTEPRKWLAHEPVCIPHQRQIHLRRPPQRLRPLRCRGMWQQPEQFQASSSERSPSRMPGGTRRKKKLKRLHESRSKRKYCVLSH